MRKPTSPSTDVASQVALLTRVTIFLLVACLGLSVCGNVYFVYENLQAKDYVAGLQNRLDIQREMHGLVQSLVMDLVSVSERDATARGLLDKYGAGLAQYNLMDLSKGSPR